MGLMDSLRKLTQPYGDEDDYFEGANGDFAPQETVPSGDAQLEFESSFYYSFTFLLSVFGSLIRILDK